MHKPEEEIRLSPFELDGKPMLDIRYWYKTRNGPRPTKRGLIIEQKKITRLIAALQHTRNQILFSEAKIQHEEVYGKSSLTYKD